MSSIQFTAFEVEEFLEQGDKVAAIGAWSGYKKYGATVRIGICVAIHGPC